MNKKWKLDFDATRYFTLIFGIILASFSYNLFMVENNIVSGGISGIAIVINKLYKINIPLFILLSNIVLILISFILLGKKATFKTILGSLLYPIFIYITSLITAFIDLGDLDLLFKAILGGLMTGFGLGLIFKEGFTTGGSDIINMIIVKYAKVNIGIAMLIVDGIIVLLGGYIFGIELMAYAIIVVLIVSAMSNKTMLDINDHKTFYIRTNMINEVKEYLIEGLKYDVTILNVIGGYKNEKGKMIMVVVKDSDYYKIRNGILTIDQNAFFIITNSYQTKNSNKHLKEVKN